MRERASAGYSGFQVGAALQSSDGVIFTGANVESASYGLTMCAERVALFTALSAGARAFRRLAIVADTATPTPPCGACRQVLWEYCGDLPIVLADLAAERARYTLAALLPAPFDGRLLE